MAFHCFQVRLYDHENGSWLSGIQMTVHDDRIVATSPGLGTLNIQRSAGPVRWRRIRNWFGGAFGGTLWCTNEDITVSDDGEECEFRIGFPLDNPYRFSLDAASGATFSCLRKGM